MVIVMMFVYDWEGGQPKYRYAFMLFLCRYTKRIEKSLEASLDWVVLIGVKLRTTL